MRAIVKATGKEVEVQDYGAKFVPRYWDKERGYGAEELSFDT